MAPYRQPAWKQADLGPLLHNRRIILFKILLVIFLLAIPIFIFYIHATGQRAQPRAKNALLENFKLPDHFQFSDLAQMVKQMRDNQEFKFYFDVSNPDTIEIVSQKAFQILKTYQTQDELLAQMGKMHKEVESSAVILNYLNFGDDFVLHPEKNPGLKETIDIFFL